MSQPAARVGDMHVCPMASPATPPVPHVGGPILPPGAINVLIGGQPAARMGDMCTCVGPPDVILGGAPTVLICGQPAARMGDMTSHGGSIVIGMPTVWIGTAGAVGSGSPVGPPTTFATQEEAARAALNQANPTSIAENTEFGGLIYQNPDGTYGYTAPSRGTGAGFSPGAVSAPAGATVVGDYHTHGDYSTVGPTGPVRTSDPALDGYNSDNFSGTDRRGIAADGAGNPNYRGYLGTPSGTFREYDPSTGTTRTI